jgi:hypothetical protein
MFMDYGKIMAVLPFFQSVFVHDDCRVVCRLVPAKDPCRFRGEGAAELITVFGVRSWSLG